MTLWLIVRKSLRQHAVSTAITAVSIALASGLLMAVWAVKDQSMRAFLTVGEGGFDAVLGSRGSELSLVLFSVFHMDKAPGTLRAEDYQELLSEKYKRLIKVAVPIVVGDNYKGFRIVGTMRNYFRLPQLEMSFISQWSPKAGERVDGLLAELKGRAEYEAITQVLRDARGSFRETARMGSAPDRDTRKQLAEMTRLLALLERQFKGVKLPLEKGVNAPERRKWNDRLDRLMREVTRRTRDIQRTGPVFTSEAPGRLFSDDKMEAVVGNFVARKLGLKRGSVFQPTHGLTYDPDAEVHPQKYVVVGVLEPTNTPADHAVWIPLKGAQNMEGHDVGKKHDVSAVLVKFLSNAGAVDLAMQINKGTRDKTMANITDTVMALFGRFEWLRVVLGAMAALTALVGAGGILASLYNTMNERRREIAILRSLGARRGTVFGAILLESTAITGLGMALGYAFYAVFMSAAAWFIREQVGVVIDPWAGHGVLWVAPVAILVMGALAGVIPARKAYATDVASNLTPQS